MDDVETEKKKTAKVISLLKKVKVKKSKASVNYLISARKKIKIQ